VKESCKSTELKRWTRAEMHCSSSSPDDARILLSKLDKKLHIDESKEPRYSTAITANDVTLCCWHVHNYECWINFEIIEFLCSYFWDSAKWVSAKWDWTHRSIHPIVEGFNFYFRLPFHFSAKLSKYHREHLHLSAFHVAAPKIWNSIPLHIRQSQTYSSSRCHLKTYYFISAHLTP